MTKSIQVLEKTPCPTLAGPDAEVLTLFHCDPAQAWEMFIERYADVILGYLRSLGFDYDQTMDRFVYVCEKLCEEDYRRLRMINYVGGAGDLSPWVRKVVARLCIDWARMANGRKRLLKSIAELPAREQHVFELYFWKGLSPTEIHEHLRLSDHLGMEMSEVLDALDHIFAHLSRKKLWRLMCALVRRQGVVSLDEIDEDTGTRSDLADAQPSPEEALIEQETKQQIVRAMDSLSLMEQSIIGLRYEKGMTAREIAQQLDLNERRVKSLVKVILGKLRQVLQEPQCCRP
jgi:RNA polymerase sigma factor (sigma-70 family)